MLHHETVSFSNEAESNPLSIIYRTTLRSQIRGPTCTYVGCTEVTSEATSSSLFVLSLSWFAVNEMTSSRPFPYYCQTLIPVGLISKKVRCSVNQQNPW